MEAKVIRWIAVPLALALSILMQPAPAAAMYGETEPSEHGSVEEAPLFIETSEILGVVVYRTVSDGLGGLVISFVSRRRRPRKPVPTKGAQR